MKKVLASCVVAALVFTGNTFAAERAKEPVKDQAEKKGGIDWTKIDRNVDISGIDKESKGSYAGFVINQDKDGNPVVAWLGLIPDGESWKLAIDADGNNKFEEAELTAPAQNKGQKANYTNFMIQKLKIRDLDFNSFSLMLMGDPAKDGVASIYFMSQTVQLGRLDYNNRIAWNNLEKAPIFDLYGFNVTVDWGKPAKMPTKGKTTVMFYLKAQGSDEKAKATMSDKFVNPKDFEVTIKYPKANGEFGELTKFIDCAC